MSKIELTQAELIDIVTLATAVVELSEKCSDGPWAVEESESRRRMKIVSPEPWRRRPPVSSGFAYEEHTDVAEVCGGKCDEARANAHAMAIGREATPALARAAIKMALLIQEKALLLDTAPDTVPDAPLPVDLATLRSSTAIGTFFERVADAVDELLTSAGHGHVSDRNADWTTRLLEDDGRELRWELFTDIAAVLDPAGDESRMKVLPPQSRVPAKARPKRQEFNDAIPEGIRMGLRGEPTMATDAEVEAEILRQLTGSAEPTEPEILEAKQRIKRVRGLTT